VWSAEKRLNPKYFSVTDLVPKMRPHYRIA
jgi:hypothetical protein